SSTSASGYEDFIYSRNYSTTARLQDIMNQHVGLLFSVNRGKKTNPNLRVLNGTNMDAILTENGFISNKDDMDKMKQVSFQNAVARAHADAIAEFLGLSKK
ncbi:MAG TPA: N-acetylmuramoyl-L-alanine amidase, partial [Massilibacterium sp.]|nr:N-acetylmuramoyl-L-alanine amidase [Massilibacterium sp.]